MVETIVVLKFTDILYIIEDYVSKFYIKINIKINLLWNDSKNLFRPDKKLENFRKFKQTSK